MPDSFQAQLELYPPRPRATFARHTLNCILFNRMLLCCPGFLLIYKTSYYIYPYILLSIFPTSLHQSWNLWPARWEIKKHTLREHLHMHFWIQPIIIPDQMFQLPTQLWSIVLDIDQQKPFPSGPNGCVRVDVLRQSRQWHPGGGLLRAGHQDHAPRHISPSNCRFTVASHSVGILF